MLADALESEKSHLALLWGIMSQARHSDRPAPPREPRDRNDFHIGVICALPLEADAVIALFDGFWDQKRSYGQASSDPNAYTLGWIDQFNVVVAHMPSMGVAPASSVAANMHSSFQNIKLGLVVGICGAVPTTSDGEEILLGDVVVSTGVILYDFGRQFPDGFKRKDTSEDNLSRPNTEVRAFLNQLRGLRARGLVSGHAWTHLQSLQKQSLLKADYPGTGKDKLFRSTYLHKHHQLDGHCTGSACLAEDDNVCDASREMCCEQLGCSDDKLVERTRKSSQQNQPQGETHFSPTLHFGLMASGNSVMKSGHHRDNMATKEKIIAFDMEGAGVWDNFPTVVIKGACDYADSHKNKEFQRYAAASAAAYMKAILGQWKVADIPSPAKQQSLNTVPYPSIISYFMGRRELLDEIDRSIFGAPDDEDRPKVLVLQAIGGQGKTQLAFQACKRAEPNHNAIFWVDATSRNTAETSFEIIADLVNTEGRPLADTASRVKYVNEALRTWEKKWLLILDNYDDIDMFQDVRDFMPESRYGTIIITSRNGAAARLGKLIVVPSMIEDNGIALVLRHYWNEQGTSEELHEAAEIVNRLGGHALALDQAASYINFYEITFSNFLIQYESKKKNIMKHRPKLFEYHNNSQEPISVFTTWEMSFDQLEAEDEVRRQYIEDFLAVCACLDPRHITEDIFSSENLFPWQQVFSRQAKDKSNITPDDSEISNQDAVEWDSTSFEQIIAQLRQINLIQKAVDARTDSQASFAIHPVVRDWLQERMKNFEHRQQAVRQCIGVLVSAIKKSSVATSSPKKRKWLLSHLDAVKLLAENIQLNPRLSSVGMKDETIAIAVFFKNEAQYSKAQKMLELLVNDHKEKSPVEDLDRVQAMSELASAYWDQGRLADAEALEVKVLEIRKRVLGEKHRDTLTTMSNLASTYRDQGRLVDAEALQEKVLEIRKQVLGEKHPGTLTSMNNLASTYQDQGRLIDAEALQVKALETRKQVLGEEHPNTLLSISNLALVYWHQGRLADAEALQVKALEINKRVLGEEHPDTLTSINNLASTYYDQGRLADAEALQLETLDIQKQVLGEEHRDSLTSMNNLASIYWHQGRLADAEALEVKVVEIRKQVLGVEHLDTLTSMHNLASTYRDQGRLADAEALYIETLEIHKRVLGAEHSSTLSSRMNLALVLHSLDRRQEAINLAESVYSSRTKLLGAEHPDTRKTLEALSEWKNKKQEPLSDKRSSLLTRLRNTVKNSKGRSMTLR